MIWVFHAFWKSRLHFWGKQVIRKMRWEFGMEAGLMGIERGEQHEILGTQSYAYGKDDFQQVSCIKIGISGNRKSGNGKNASFI